MKSGIAAQPQAQIWCFRQYALQSLRLNPIAIYRGLGYQRVGTGALSYRDGLSYVPSLGNHTDFERSAIADFRNDAYQTAIGEIGISESFARLVQHFVTLRFYEFKMGADEVVFVVWDPQEDAVGNRGSVRRGPPLWMTELTMAIIRIGFVDQFLDASLSRSDSVSDATASQTGFVSQPHFFLEDT